MCAKLRTGGVNFALFLVSTVLILCLVELVFRVTGFTDSSDVWSDRPVDYYLPQGAREFADFRYSEQKPENTFRIIVVGDSFTHPSQMHFDDTFPKRLERLLNLNTSQQKVEVWNLGIPGYSTQMEIDLVRKSVRYYSPDLLILQITLNDPAVRHYSEVRREKEKSWNKWRSGVLYSHWQTFSFVVDRIYNTRTHSDYASYLTDLFYKQSTWDLFRRSLTTIKEMADGRKTPFVAVVFPVFTFPLDDSYPVSKVHGRIQRYFKSIHVPLLDLLPFYRGIPHMRLQVVPVVNSHPNEIAHRIAADRILRWLIELKLVPEGVIPQNKTSSLK